MLSIYLKSSFRQLRKHQLYTSINIIGIAIGITAMLLAILYWQHELSFDKFHVNRNNIFRITTTLREHKDAEIKTVGATGQVQGPAFSEAIPAIRKFTRVFGGDIYNEVFVNDRTHRIQPLFVDPAFLDMFTFPFVSGSKSAALDDIGEVILTASTAKRLFGTTDIVGKTLSIEADPSFERLGKPLIVSGVLLDPPSNSSLQFDVLFPFSYLQLSFTDEAWLNAYLGTFLLLDPGANPQLIAKQFLEVYRLRGKEQLSASLREYQFDPDICYGLQQLGDIHLNPLIRTSGNVEAGIINGSRKLYSVVFLSISGFILLMASINFINISIARSLKRSKEVGVRKISGGSTHQIVTQFLVESLVVCVIAFILSVISMFLLLPLFNDLAGKHLGVQNILSAPYIFSLFLLLVIFCSTTGLYPAFILARFKPAEVLYNKQKSVSTLPGKLLVLMQFVPAIFLLIAALIYYQQMNFIRSKDLGYNPDHVIKTGIYGDRDYAAAKRIIRNELKKEPSIRQVSFGNIGYPFFLQVNQKNFEVVHKAIDTNYIPLMELKLLQGKNISSSDIGNHEAIVNETFVRRSGLSDPIGKRIKLSDYYANQEKTIIGVVKDHHHQSVRNKLSPLVMFVSDREEGDMWVKLDKSKSKEALVAVQSAYRKAMPTAIFEYAFIDELNAREFKEEKRWQQVVTIGTAISMFICCLGLFGLAHLSAFQRVKEIGIRKVLGASVSQIVVLLSSRFLKPVTVAFLVAAPAALIVMREWLNNFAYRIVISPLSFGIAGCLCLLVSFAAVFYQSFRAAHADPVSNLRTE